MTRPALTAIRTSTRLPPLGRLLLGLAVAVSAVLLYNDIRGAEGERDATATRAVTALDPVQQLCQEDGTVGAALRADRRNPCGLATEVLTDPVVTDAVAAGVTADEVIALIAAELDRRPADTFTGAELAAAVRQVLAANPGLYRSPPTGPTQVQVDLAVAALIAADPSRYEGPPGVDGTDGMDGADGTSPACLIEPGQCRGRGIVAAQVVDCRWQVTYTDGVTEDAGTACAPAGDGPGPDPPPAEPSPAAGPAPTPAQPDPAAPPTTPPSPDQQPLFS